MHYRFASMYYIFFCVIHFTNRSGWFDTSVSELFSFLHYAMPPTKAKTEDSDEDSDIPGSDWGSSDNEDSSDDDSASGEDITAEGDEGQVILCDGKQVPVGNVHKGDGFYAVALKTGSDVVWAKPSDTASADNIQVFEPMSSEDCQKAAKEVNAKMFDGDTPTAAESARFKAATGAAYPKQLLKLKKKKKEEKKKEEKKKAVIIRVGKTSGPVIAHNNFPEDVHVWVILNNGRHYWVVKTDEGKHEMMPVKDVREMLKTAGMGSITKENGKAIDEACIKRYGVKCAAQVHNAIDRQVSARKKKAKLSENAPNGRGEKRAQNEDEDEKVDADTAKKRCKKDDVCETTKVDPPAVNAGGPATSPVATVKGSVQTVGEVTFTWRGSIEAFKASSLVSL